ncbi:transglutaminase-like domain-containing protein [Spongiimicrobium sp. 2-473A-2-J]|uniref:transglutaminase-like domain-containing protein n=1 Tax=Eudoraea algarum TaxID=3417568 RepID=UPI003D35F7E1
MKDMIIVEEDVELDYIASKKVKSIFIPSEYETKISYTVECSELMYFSDLRFFSNNTIDTLKYQITVPKTFRFIHNTIYKDSLDYMAIDSISSDSITRWNIKVVPEKIEPDPLTFFGIYRNKKVPLMRTIVVPVSYKDDGLKYLNDWYLQKVETKRGLNPEVLNKIDELTKGVSDPRQVMEILYNYVRSNFKYVAIEIGMGAFIPTHANEVFSNKEGDCKDLSNFLSEALNYKGIKSHIALAATYDHISDCDFPSLSSANHVVCLAYIKDEPIVLDPTDPIHFPETPVQSIQNRSILIINPNGGERYKIKGFTPQQNLIDYEIGLKANSDRMLMEGEFKAWYNGISGNFLRREFRYIGKDKMNSAGKRYYESVFGNQSISDFKVNHNANSIGAEGKISINGKIFNDTNNRMLFLDFLPRIIETENRETLLEGTHLGSNFNKNVNLRIEMDEIFETFAPIEHTFSDKGVSLHLKISNPSDFIIECNYEFMFDYITIEKDNHAITNEVLKSFKKIINEPIILRKKG